MNYPTWGSLKAQIKDDLDLHDENFIDDDMLTAWMNNAIAEAESHVMSTSADYFLQMEPLEIQAGVAFYSLPQNIKATKIRKVLFDDGSCPYEIKRIRKIEHVACIEDGDRLRYILAHSPTQGTRFRFYPTPVTPSVSDISIWFIGSANRVVEESDLINIPEAVNFLLSYVKLECYRREGHPGQVAMESERERQRRLLIETLTEMVPDENDEIIIDTSIYDEMV